ncbi:MAG: ABC transporter permease [Planctomycetaceae bacterium]|nr:ABC transporter permease [Planctomycetaceae bacterium]
MSTAEMTSPRTSADVPATPPEPVRLKTVIEPPRGWLRLNLEEVWRYRDLLSLLIWRDLSARYRQSVVGYGWAFIKPIVSVLIFAMVFGGLAGLPSDGVPYPLFALAALIPWTYFSASLMGVSTSVTNGGHLLTKVYFPRLILPLSSLGAGLADLGLQLLLVFGFMAFYGFAPSWPLLLLPLFTLYVVVASLAFGLWLTALNVRYRDVGHAVPFLLQAWMWLSPVVYSSSLVPAKWRWLYAINPLVGIIDGFRWCLLNTAPPDGMALLISMATVILTLLGGLMYFRHQEATFADII